MRPVVTLFLPDGVVGCRLVVQSKDFKERKKNAYFFIWMHTILLGVKKKEKLILICVYPAS